MSSYLIGFHAIRARMKSAPQSIEQIWLKEQRKDKRTQELLGEINAKKIQLSRLDNAAFALRLTQCSLDEDSSHQGIIAAVAPLAQITTLDQLIENLPERVLLLVLDGVTDPHNLGACLRVADAAGVMAVIAPKDHSAPLSAITRKVASGAAEHLPYLQVVNLVRALEQLKKSGFWIIGTDEKGDDSLYASEFSARTALVLGAEGAGMRQLTRGTCDQLIHIPMAGSVESLNVSVAAGVCLFEAVRQNNAVSFI